MSDAGYIPDHLYERLFQPWKLPESEWPLCKEDWARVDAVTALPWEGRVIDVGCGDGTLGAMVKSRNPSVSLTMCDNDMSQLDGILSRWAGWLPVTCYGQPGPTLGAFKYDGALCCEVLEHLEPKEGREVLESIAHVLKRNALICVTVPMAGGSRDKYTGHVRSFKHCELRDELDRLGFGKIVEVPVAGIWWMATARA